MKMTNLKKHKKILLTLIVSMVFTNPAFAGQFFFDNGVKKYIDENGMIATGWRWVDDNNDNIAECYRFEEDGSIATKSTFKGKDINEHGQWVINGIVQRIYKSSGMPLYSANAALGEVDDNDYFDIGTYSQSRRLNATKKQNMRDIVEADLRRFDENYTGEVLGPNGKFIKPDEGFVLSRGAKSVDTKRPIATRSSWAIINTVQEEDEIRVVTSTESIVAGREMKKFIASSNKYTESVDNVKIWGGDVWSGVMMLQGNGAYAKFVTTDDKTKFKANYFTIQVAHQTHGESTADTYCAIELYVDGKSVAVYDDFCDGDPETIEVYLDDGEKNIELRAIVTGDAPGRKIYIKNARFRMIREKKEE